VLQIADFGLARVCCVDELNNELLQMTEHAVTRWYRPPELMLSPNRNYTCSIDMWSVGCIFAEMLGKKPLFPGKSFVHQLSLIFDLIGAPSQVEISHIRGARALKFLRSLKDHRAIPFERLFPTASDEALDLLRKLLTFNPVNRLSATLALNHPYFDAYKELNRSSIPMSSQRKDIDFDFEYHKNSTEQLMALVSEEVNHFYAMNKPMTLREQSNPYDFSNLNFRAVDDADFATWSTADCREYSRGLSDELIIKPSGNRIELLINNALEIDSHLDLHGKCMKTEFESNENLNSVKLKWLIQFKQRLSKKHMKTFENSSKGSMKAKNVNGTSIGKIGSLIQAGTRKLENCNVENTFDEKKARKKISLQRFTNSHWPSFPYL
jgi:serine/threonine protein kinase